MNADDQRGQLIRTLLARERALLADWTSDSAAEFESARRVIPNGITSDFHWVEPYPVYLRSGRGATVTTIDGRELVDLHMAAGAAICGHANSQIGAALTSAATGAVCLAAPSPDAVPVARSLRDRFGLAMWRFVNSGTEATMTAIRIARAMSGRDLVVRVAGAYHGHHEAALAGLGSEPDGGGAFAAGRWDRGVPAGVARLVRLVAFNDAVSLERLLERLDDRVACVIVEMPLLTPEFALPDQQFVDVLNSARTQHGAYLIADEVKTGVAVGWGGGARLVGLTPDLVVVGKGIGGGVPIGAVGGTVEAMQSIGQSGPAVVGTFNGNPLAMAAARVALDEVLVPSAYDSIDNVVRATLEGQRGRRVADELAVTLQVCGARGQIAPLRPDPLFVELLWCYLLNRGVYLGPSPDLRFTISIAHTTEDLERFVEALVSLAAELALIRDS